VTLPVRLALRLRVRLGVRVTGSRAAESALDGGPPGPAAMPLRLRGSGSESHWQRHSQCQWQATQAHRDYQRQAVQAGSHGELLRLPYGLSHWHSALALNRLSTPPHWHWHWPVQPEAVIGPPLLHSSTDSDSDSGPASHWQAAGSLSLSLTRTRRLPCQRRHCD